MEERHEKKDGHESKDTLTSEESNDGESVVNLDTAKKVIDCINLEQDETEDNDSDSPESQGNSGIESESDDS